MRSVRLLLAPAALGLATLLTGAGLLHAEDKPVDPKLFTELVKGMRAYLEIDGDPYPGREATRAAMAKIEAGGGPRLLADPALLRRATDQARDFDVDYRDRKWQKAGDTEVTDGKFSISVSSPDKLRLAFSVPKTYTEAALAKMPRSEPVPTLITLIEEKDFVGKKFPGEETIARRYAAQKELFERWFVFAPVAVRGKYVEDGNVRQLFFTAQFKDFYQRYHVDFERVVLDGDAATVTTIAAAQPFLFAGLVVRRPLNGEPTFDPDIVSNYGHIPIFVMGCPLTEKALKAAGHADVTLGDEAALPAWLGQRKRTAPKSFSWRVKSAQHVFANWLIVTPDWNAEKRTIDVNVVDTPEKPNTIEVEATGILDMTALLHDGIVNLDKEVRFVVNGQEISKKKHERSLERVFDKDPVEARRAIFYGLLFTTMTHQLFPPPPKVEAPPTPAAPAAPGDPVKEEQAANLMQTAEDFAANGNGAKAVQIFEKVLKDFGDTSHAPKAQARLAEIKAAGEPPK